MHLIGEGVRHAGGERRVLVWHVHHLREDGLGYSQQHRDDPYRDGLQAGPEYGAGGLDVHRVHNSFVSKGNICEELSSHRLPFLSSRLDERENWLVYHQFIVA